MKWCVLYRFKTDRCGRGWRTAKKSGKEFTTEGTEYTESRSNPRGRGPFDRTQGKQASPLHYFREGDGFGVSGIGIGVGVGGWGHLAAAAIGEDKHTRAGAVLVNGHSGSPEKLNFRLSGKPAQERSRAHFSMGGSVAVGYGVVK